MSQAAEAWSWINEPDLMGRLIAAQNHPKNINLDIMSFAAFCDDRDELERHVVRFEATAAGWDERHQGAF